MTNFADFSGFKNLVMNFKQQIIESKKKFSPNGEMCVDKATFYKDNPNADKSIFSKLDLDNDGYVSQFEFSRIKMLDTDGDGTISKSEAEENKQNCMREAMFFARRNIDKWFTIDVNRDGQWSNVEEKMADYRMAEICDDPNHIMDSSLSNEELVKKYMMLEKPTDMSIEKWINSWLDYIKTEVAQKMYGVELTSNDMAVLKSECIKQLNTWLFKTGDNATHDAPLYNSLNVTAYTRLMTTESAVSCCGGDITPPPMAPEREKCSLIFRPLEFSQEQFIEARKEGRILDEGSLTNSASEMKNRLAWAAFPTLPKDKLSDSEKTGTVWMNFSEEEYSKLHNQWNKLRSTSAGELRELLRPENYLKRMYFEANTIMTVAQMVQFIDIVESVTGHSWDDENWEITSDQFYQIGRLVNDTEGDETRLDGKTREDVPQNRQKLLHFLEEKGWLNDQFKVDNVEVKQKTDNVETQLKGVQEYWQKNDKNVMVYNRDLNKATRKVLSNIEQARIKAEKEKELQQLYNPNEYEYVVEVNKFGDLHWAVRKRENV